MELLTWIGIGLLINTVIMKNDLIGESALVIGPLVLLRSVTGGLISNYVFAGGLGNLNFFNFAICGLLPLTLLLINYFVQQTPKENSWSIGRESYLNI